MSRRARLLQRAVREHERAKRRAQRARVYHFKSAEFRINGVLFLGPFEVTYTNREPSKDLGGDVRRYTSGRYSVAL